MYNIPIFFAEIMWVAHFFSRKFQRICVARDVNFNESLTNDIVSFEQLGPSLLEHIEEGAFIQSEAPITAVQVNQIFAWHHFNQRYTSIKGML